MQKGILLAAIACVLFFIGLTVYLEIGKRNITKNPSQLPPAAHPSTVVEHPSNDASAGSETHSSGDAPQMGITTTKKMPDDDSRPTDGEHGHRHSDDKEQHTENDEAGTTREPFTGVIDMSIEDPYERAEVYRASLINHFGNIPQVHTLADNNLERWLGISHDLDHSIKLHEAIVHLYPGPSDAAEQLELLKKEKAKQESGEVVTYTEPSSPEMLNLKTQYPELGQIVNQYGPDGFREAVRRFSELNPEKAIAFKRALWNTPEVQNALKSVDATELEEIKEFFGDIMIGSQK